jgi:putative FmdB family regulatory protein
MAVYEFLCKQCNKVFDVSFSIREYERKKKSGIRCSKCGSTKVIRQVSAFQVNTAKKS